MYKRLLNFIAIFSLLVSIFADKNIALSETKIKLMGELKDNGVLLSWIEAPGSNYKYSLFKFTVAPKTAKSRISTATKLIDRNLKTALPSAPRKLKNSSKITIPNLALNESQISKNLLRGLRGFKVSKTAKIFAADFRAEATTLTKLDTDVKAGTIAIYILIARDPMDKLVSGSIKFTYIPLTFGTGTPSTSPTTAPASTSVPNPVSTSTSVPVVNTPTKPPVSSTATAAPMATSTKAPVAQATSAPTVAPTATMAGMAGMPMPSGPQLTNLPKGDPGTSERIIIPSPFGLPPLNGSMDDFRTLCRFTHYSYDDPIVFPGQPGRSHLHLFFGNTGVDAFTTPDNIRDVGKSACDGGSANKSGYWMPAILDADGNPVLTTEGLGRNCVNGGNGKDCEGSIWYYKSDYQIAGRYDLVVAPPKGLRMISGNGKATSPQGDESRGGFYCHDRDGSFATHIVDCSQGSVLEMIVDFPQCWDGKNLDSPDHKSHMAHANNGCPASHPVVLPKIGLHARFKVLPATGTKGWRLSSDMYDTKANPGGYSFHADWMNGWEPGILESIVKNCHNKNIGCGTSNMGDGNRLDYH